MQRTEGFETTRKKEAECSSVKLSPTQVLQLMLNCENTLEREIPSTHTQTHGNTENNVIKPNTQQQQQVCEINALSLDVPLIRRHPPPHTATCSATLPL